MCNFLVTIITRTSGTPGDAFIVTRYAPKPKKSGLVWQTAASGTFAFGFVEPA